MTKCTIGAERIVQRRLPEPGTWRVRWEVKGWRPFPVHKLSPSTIEIEDEEELRTIELKLPAEEYAAVLSELR